MGVVSNELHCFGQLEVDLVEGLKVLSVVDDATFFEGYAVLEGRFGNLDGRREVVFLEGCLVDVKECPVTI